MCARSVCLCLCLCLSRRRLQPSFSRTRAHACACIQELGISGGTPFMPVAIDKDMLGGGKSSGLLARLRGRLPPSVRDHRVCMHACKWFSPSARAHCMRVCVCIGVCVCVCVCVPVCLSVDVQIQRASMCQQARMHEL